MHKAVKYFTAIAFISMNCANALFSLCYFHENDTLEAEFDTIFTCLDKELHACCLIIMSLPDFNLYLANFARFSQLIN